MIKQSENLVGIFNTHTITLSKDDFASPERFRNVLSCWFWSNIGMLKSLFQLKRAVPPRPESPPFELYHCKFTRIQSLEKIKVSVTPTVEPSTEDFSVKNFCNAVDWCLFAVGNEMIDQMWIFKAIGYCLIGFIFGRKVHSVCLEKIVTRLPLCCNCRPQLRIPWAVRH